MSVKQHEPMCFDSAQDRWWWMDHFLGDQIQDEWDSMFVGAGTNVVVDQQTGGIVRLTTGALANNSNILDWNDIRSLHVTKRVSSEYRVKLNSTSNEIVRIFLRFDWSNCIFFEYASATLANWRIRTTDGGAPTIGDSGIAADTSYHIFRIECHTHGGNHVHFYIDGTQTANSPINTNIPDDAADFLQPYLYIETTDAVLKSMDVDYCYVRQER